MKNATTKIATYTKFSQKRGLKKSKVPTEGIMNNGSPLGVGNMFPYSRATIVIGMITHPQRAIFTSKNIHSGKSIKKRKIFFKGKKL